MSPWVRRSGIVMWLMVTWAGPTLAIEPDRVRTILAEATYTMADQDTLAAAEQSTLLRAQRNAVEQAGVYLESTFTDTASSTSSLAVQRSSLAIRAISAAILRTEVLERKVAVDHGRPVFLVRIRATVDLQTLEEAVQRIHREDGLTRHFHELRSENAALRAKLAQVRRDVTPPRVNGASVRIESSAELTRRAIRAGSWLEKIALTSEALAANPREHDAFVIRGQTLLHVASLGQVPDPDPADRDWLLEKAKSDFSDAITIHQASPWAWFGRAEALAMEGRTEEALADYQHLLRVDPFFDLGRERMTERTVAAAKASMEKGEWTVARDLLERLLGEAPDSTWIPYQAEAYLLRSRAYLALHRPESALRDLSTLIEAVPQHQEAHYQRAKVYRQLGRLDLADSDLSIACALRMRVACKKPS